MSKGLGNGYPISGFVAKHEIGTSDKLQGSLSSTYMGNILGCVAACMSRLFAFYHCR